MTSASSEKCIRITGGCPLSTYALKKLRTEREGIKKVTVDACGLQDVCLLFYKSTFLMFCPPNSGIN